MHLKRNIRSAKAPTLPIVSPSAPPPVPSKTMVESVSAAPPTLPQKSSKKTSPFKIVLPVVSAKLASLESSNAHVLVSSPTDGIFRRGRKLKGKKQPPISKESDAAGEVVKLLFKEGEAVGYGDHLIAVLPSFPGIK